jgi:hypothetical protein
MPAKMTIGKVQRIMKRLASNIRALTRRQARLGKPISYGVFPDPPPPPNTVITHAPTTWTPGN